MDWYLDYWREGVRGFVKENVINGKFENGDMSVDDVINDFRLLESDKGI